MNTRQMFENHPWRKAVALATGSAALIFAGCADDADDGYTAVDEREQTRTATDNSAVHTPADNAQRGYETGQQDMAASEGTAEQRASNSTYTARSDQRNASEEDEQSAEGATVQDSAEIALREESLEVEKQRVADGGVLLRKEVEEEQATESVELRDEDIEVVRLSPEEARQRQEEGAQSEFSQNFSEEEVFIPTMKEEAVAEKEVNVTEVVRADTEQSQEDREINATLRSEELEIEREGRASQDSEQYSASYSFDSEDLRAEVMDTLRNGDLNLSEEQISQIEIQVEEDRVTLSGEAPSDDMANRIEQAISDIDQVESVENNLSS